MKPAIIASRKDKAGMNIAGQLEKLNFKINYTDKELVYADNIDKEIEGDFIIFISKHRGAKGKMLSLHAPGNWRKAELGGREGEICKTSAFFLKHIFKILNQENEKAGSDYEVTLEVTHHGPYIEKPCCFIEIGSSEKEWQDKKAGKIIAKTIKKAVEDFNKEKINQGKLARKPWLSCIGIGGPHYCPNFNKIQLNSEYALGHIIPNYIFPINEEMLKQAIERTKEKVEVAIIDWKGLKSEERQEAITLLNQLSLKYMRTKEVEK